MLRFMILVIFIIGGCGKGSEPILYQKNLQEFDFNKNYDEESIPHNADIRNGVFYINHLPIESNTYAEYKTKFDDIIKQGNNFHQKSRDKDELVAYITTAEGGYDRNNLFTELYLYYFYKMDFKGLDTLLAAQNSLESKGIDVNITTSYQTIFSLFIPQILHSKEFYQDWIKYSEMKHFFGFNKVLNGSILAYWISQKNMDKFLEWKKIIDYDLNDDSSKYIDWHSENILLAALTYPPALDYFYENNYITNAREEFYTSVIDYILEERTNKDGRAMLMDLHGAYPEMIDFRDKDNLSIYYKYKDDTNFISYLIEQGLNTNTTEWNYQLNAEELFRSILAKDSSQWAKLVEPITNINDIRFKDLDSNLRIGEGLFEVLFNVGSYYIYNTNNLSFLLDSGLEATVADYNLICILLDVDTNLAEYLKTFPLPKYTDIDYYSGMHGSKSITKYITNRAYDYYITTALHQNRTNDLKLLIEYGYLDEVREQYLQYALDNELPLALTLITTNSSDPRVQKLLAYQTIQKAVDNDDYDEFVHIAGTYDINSHYGILYSIFKARNFYYSNGSLTTNSIKMLKYLADNGYDFGMPNSDSEYTGNQLEWMLNDQNYAGWHEDYLFLEYLKAKLPLPQNVFDKEVLSYDKDEYPAPGSNISLIHLIARNNRGDMLKLINEQGYVDFSDPLVAQELFKSIERGAYQSVQFFIDNDVDLTATLDEETVVDFTWNLSISDGSYTHYNGTGIGSYNDTRTLILETYKDKFLKALPQYSNLYCYALAPDITYSNSIQNIQYNLAQEGKDIEMFHPFDFQKFQYNNLFNRNIDKDTPVELLLVDNNSTDEYYSNSYELFVFALTNGADINRIITNSRKNNLLMEASKARNNSSFVFLLNQDNIDFSYRNELGNTVLHELAQDYSEQCAANNYSITERIFMLPLDKIDVNATNNEGLTFYWLLNRKKMFYYEETLKKVLDILKIDTNIGEKTENGGRAYVVG